MDFNSIFNRAPNEGLAARLQPGTLLEEWENFLTTIYPRGRNEDTIQMLKEQYPRVKAKQTQFEQLAAASRGYPAQQQLYMHGERAASVLLEEIEKFNRSGHIITDEDMADSRRAWEKDRNHRFPDIIESDAFSDLIHVDIARDHKNILAMYEGLVSTAKVLQSTRDPSQKDTFSRGIHKLYGHFQQAKTELSNKYAGLKRSTKSKLPARAKPLVDKVVELFIEDPLESGILVIRRNFPGAIGALHGLEEEG